MPNRNIVVIGASAGGVEALSRLVKQLSPNLTASLFIVVHFPSYGTSYLPKILGRFTSLPVLHANHQQPIQPGHIYVARPDYHLLLYPDRLELSRAARENGHRPAIDPLFQSAAQVFQSRVVGVILSGNLDDGTAGLSSIHKMGGLTIVQDPEEALFDGMPRSAIATIPVHHILKTPEIAELLNQLPQSPPLEESSVPPAELPNESDIVAKDKAALERGDRPGQPSTLTCPDCGGVLWELQDGNLLRFRCHTGHAYSLDSLMAEQADEVERALWSAVRILEEKAALSRRMANHAQQQNHPLSQSKFLAQAEKVARYADLVQQIITQQSLKLPITSEGSEERLGVHDSI